MTVLASNTAPALAQLPDSWSWTQLGRIGEALIGLTYSPKSVSRSGTLVLRSSNVDDGALRFDDNVFVRMSVPDRALVRKDDILICARNGSRALIGKCAKIDERAAGMAFGAFMAVFRTADHGIVFYNLQSGLMRQQIEAHLGATINQITNASLSGFWVPYPDSPGERAAIAATLSDVDALLTKLDQLIAKKRDLKRTAMQLLLTGHRRLSGFSDPWGERALQSVVTRLEAGVSVRSVEGEAGGSDCFVLKTSAVADGNFDASERKPVIPADRGRVRCPVRAGTVLVSRMNTPDLVGEVGFVDRDHPNSFLPDRLWAASVPKGAVSARWLSYVLSSSEYKQRLRDVATGTSGSMKNISKGAFLGISVKVPTLDEQSAIAQVLSDMDAELVALEARSDKTRQLKQGMMQALLTGQIRLV